MNLDFETAPPHPRVSVKVGYLLSDLPAPGMGNMCVVPGSQLLGRPDSSDTAPEGAYELTGIAGDAGSVRPPPLARGEHELLGPCTCPLDVRVLVPLVAPEVRDAARRVGCPAATRCAVSSSATRRRAPTATSIRNPRMSPCAPGWKPM